MCSVASVASNAACKLTEELRLQASSISQDARFLVTTAANAFFRNAHSATVSQVICKGGCAASELHPPVNSRHCSAGACSVVAVSKDQIYFRINRKRIPRWANKPL